MKTIRFYAIDDDLLDVLMEVEQRFDLQYVKAGTMPSSAGLSMESYAKASEIPQLGRANHESASGCNAFLVFKKGSLIQRQAVTLEDGSEAFAINELLNQGAATLTPAGRWSDDVVLYGTFGSAHGTDDAKEILGAFEKALRRRFTKVKAYWLGPKALRALEEGKRLTLAAQTPRDFDLSLR